MAKGIDRAKDLLPIEASYPTPLKMGGGQLYQQIMRLESFKGIEAGTTRSNPHHSPCPPCIESL